MLNTSNTNKSNKLTVDRLHELLFAAREKERLALVSKDTITTTQIKETLISTQNKSTQSIAEPEAYNLHSGELITYNPKQLEFINLITEQNSSCILIGAAGTGKTTCMRGVISSLIQSGKAGLITNCTHKYLINDTPGIVAVSFTRRAVANLRKAMPENMKTNCLTIHALLEYQPVYYSIIDPITGMPKNTMRFECTRNPLNPLPFNINYCLIDESSMVSVDPLFKELQAALPAHCKFIFLGDIQQLPPVFGSAILGFKMLELPTVELTEVYRQALESPIIRLAHRILSGSIIPEKEYSEWCIPDKLTIRAWKKKVNSDIATFTISKLLVSLIDSGHYDPIEDMVLLPFNKSCGTIEVNKRIANHLAKKRSAVTYEIISGFNKLYLSPGDKVLVDKEDGTIKSITYNMLYRGKSPIKQSPTLDYWGVEHSIANKIDNIQNAEFHDDELDFTLSQIADNKEDRVQQSSHIITVDMTDGREITLETASEVNALLLGYALTIHKSQGSEYRKVFLMLHQSHATALCRELLYTAVTRAKEELYILCEPETFTNGIRTQKIKGNTLAEKAEFFKGKVDKINKESEKGEEDE